MLHHVSNTLLGYWSSTFQVRVFGEKKGKKKRLKQHRAVRMDLYQIEGSNQNRKSGRSAFPDSLETADTSPPTFPWEITSEEGQFCLPLGLLGGPSRHRVGASGLWHRQLHLGWCLCCSLTHLLLGLPLRCS